MKKHYLAALFCIAALAPAADAALNAYEPFDYGSVGADLQGNNGGFGFSAPWVPGGLNAFNSNNYDIAAGSLASGSLLTQGNSVASGSVNAISGVTRSLTVPLGAPGTTAYISFLLEPQGTLGDGAFAGFFGVTLDSPLEPEVFLGKPGAGALDKYVIEERGGANQQASGVTTQVNQTALIVVRAQFGLAGSSDTFTMFVNPTPGAAEPASGTTMIADIASIDQLGLYSTGAYRVDELRVGDTFSDVTPTAAVPEGAPGLSPLIALLTGLGLVHHFAMRRQQSLVAVRARTTR
jgi:hypothetical protein